MTAFWIIGAIVSYIAIGVCVSAADFCITGSSEGCVEIVFLWPFYLLTWVVPPVWFAIKWAVFRLAGKNYSWKEFMDDYD